MTEDEGEVGTKKEEEEEELTKLSQKKEETSDFGPETVRRGKCGEPTWTDTLRQIVASCIVHCIVIQAGVNMAYSTVLTGGLRPSNEPGAEEDKEHRGMTIDKADESWIASLVTITLPAGALIAGPLMDRFGRKRLCIGLCIPTMLSWILLIVSESLSTIYAARIIAGMTAGLTSVGLVYVIEITHPRVRAMLLCLNSVFVSLGILLTCLFALCLDWRRMAMLFLALNLCIFLALFALPESPYWLACFGQGFRDPARTANAERSLRWLNPRKWMYEQEYSRIKEMSEKTRPSRSDSTPSPSPSPRDYLREARRPLVYKPMLLLAVILLMQQLSGAYVVIFYAISVFREIGGSFGGGLDEYGALVLLGVIRFFMSILTAFLSRTVGRRSLCIASGLGMSFAMFFSAMFIHLTLFCEGFADSSMARHKWMLLVVVLFYVCTSTLGFVVIPWTLIGELLPISFRGVGGGIMISFAYLAMFGVIKSYPFALDALGPRNVFFFFSVTSLVGTAVVYLFLPETLGKSFKEIEQFFASRASGNGGGGTTARDIDEKKQAAALTVDV